MLCKPTTYVSSLRDPDVWKQVLHSQVGVKGITHAVGPSRAGPRFGPYCLTLRRTPAETPAARRLSRPPGTHLTVIDNVDHTFTPKFAREEMLS